MENLPPEILLHIFNYLHHDDLKKCLKVCKKFYNISAFPEIQKRFVLKLSNENNESKLATVFDNLKFARFKAIYFYNLHVERYLNLFNNEILAENIEEVMFYKCENIRPEIFIKCLEKFINLKKLKHIENARVMEKNEVEEWNNEKHKIDDIFSKLEYVEIVEKTNMLKKNKLENILMKFINTRNLKTFKLLLHNNVAGWEEFSVKKNGYIYSRESEQCLYQILRGNSKTLKNFHLGHFFKTDRFLKSINIINLKLEKLELSSYSYAWQNLDSLLRQQTNLVYLNLSDTEALNDSHTKIMINLKNLKTLNVSRCEQLSKTSLKYFMQLKKLQSLNISYNDKLVNIKDTIAREPNETMLEFYSIMVSFNELSYIKMAENFPNIKVLHCGSRSLNDVGIQAILKNCPKLVDLNLFGSSQITDYGLTGIHSPLSIKTGMNICELENLAILNLRRCSKITDQTLIHGLRLNTLKVLHLPSCFPFFIHLPSIKIRKISIAGFTAFVRHCPNIEQLNLMGCSGYENLDKGIKIILTGLRHLKLLKLARHCERCTYPQEVELRSSRKDLSNIKIICQCDTCLEIKKLCNKFFARG